MSGYFFGKQFSSFQIIITGFLSVILTGTLLLTLPIASSEGIWTPVSYNKSLLVLGEWKAIRKCFHM